MIELLKNPWVILSLVFALIASHGFVGYKAYNAGYDARELKYNKAENKAEDTASENIQDVRTKSKIVYKYIREQNNDCDIYDNVIDQLREPQGNSR